MAPNDHMNTSIVPDVEYLSDIQTHSDRYLHTDIVILYVNIRSAINKWTDFEAYLAQLPISPDIIIVVETWFRAGETKYYNLENYVPFHCTRTHNLNQGRGGGTSVFVRNTPRLLATCRDTVCFNDSTILIIKLHKLNMHIIATYRPEQTNRRLFNEKLGELLSAYKRAIGIGDFNMNLLDGDSSIANYRATLLCNGHALLNSESLTAGTRNGNIIDHIFTDLFAYKYLLSNTNFSMSDHNKLMLTIKLDERQAPNQVDAIQIIDYTRIDSSPLWDNIASTQSFNELSILLQQLINYNRRSLVSNRSNRKTKPWITNHILDLIKIREFYFSYHRRFPENEYVASEYKQYKRRTTIALKKAKKEYFNDKMNSSVSNPKAMWATLRELMYNRTSTPQPSITAVKSNGILFTNQQTLVEKFSDYFSNVATDLHNENTDPNQQYIDSIAYHVPTETRLVHATTEDVHAAINRLKSNAATGQDGISAKFVKRYIGKLIEPLTNCINNAISAGTYPQVLKHASVVPIWKSGDCTICSNYRPISVLSSLNMIFEDILKNWLVNLLDTNNIIHPCQFGFTKNSNTETAVLHLTHTIAKGIQDGFYTAVLFLDLRKAFDSVDHRILLGKLAKLGLTENELQLLESYLTHRTQSVKIGTKRSSTRRLPPIAVPQGSRVGPVLFNFTTNDMHQLELCGEVQLFADDTAVKYRAKSLEQLRRDIQHDLTLISEWLTNNKLKANSEKTKFMVFSKSERGATQIDQFDFLISLNEKRIQRVRSYEYLGVVIDDKMHWNAHIDKVRDDISPYVFALRKMRPYVSESTASQVYNAFVASRLVYASPVWRTAPNYKLQTLRVLQHSAIKTIRRLPWLTSSSSLFSPKLLSIDNLILLRLLLYVHKIVNDEIRHNFNLQLISNMHSYPTRNNQNYYVDQRGGRTVEADILKHGLYRYNQLPAELKQEGSIIFKNKLRIYLSDLGTT